MDKLTQGRKLHRFNRWGAIMLIRISAAVAMSLAAAAYADTPGTRGSLIVDVPNLQSPPPQTAAEPKAKIICKSDYEIGSLVKRVRWCATAAEWRESERSAKSTTGHIQDGKGRYSCSASGCAPATDG